MRASCSLTVETTETTDPEWEGGSIQRNRLAKAFTGDLVGTSSVEALSRLPGVSKYGCDPSSAHDWSASVVELRLVPLGLG